MRKRITSLFLVLALCLTLLPTAALATENTTEPSTQLTEPTPVPQEPETPGQGENTKTPDQPEEPPQDEEPPAAEEVAPDREVSETADSPHTHPICGETCTDGTHTGNSLTWTGISSLNDINQTGNYYLTKDVTLSETWTCNDDVTLCLNGYSIKAEHSSPIITVAQGKTFTLTDCNSSKSSKHFKKDDSSGRWVQDVDGTITVNGGAVFHPGNKAGLGVNVPKNGTFTMYGGTICGNSGGSGGGVRVFQSGTFNMYGGTICGNIGSYGSGVYVDRYGTFNMSGNAAITGNTGTYSGGVSVDGTFNMSGDAAITGNGSPRSRGGVHVSGKDANMNVSGNVQIKDNWRGGTLTADKGVYVKGDSGSANNLCLVQGQVVTIDDSNGLSSNAHIGVTTENVPAKIATDATKELSYYTNIFTPDVQNQGYMITKDENENALYLSAHQHNWGFTSNGATITATCSKCSASGGSVTINKPAYTTYGDGQSEKATLTENSWQGLAVNEDAITYTKGSTSLEAAPTDAGTYTASITVGDATASVEYTIQRADPKASDFTFAAPSPLTYDGNAKTATVKPNTGINGMGAVTVKYFKNGVETEPKDAGDYTVKVSVAEGANYNATTDNLTTDGWKFTIGKATQTIIVPTDKTIVKDGIAEDISDWATVAGVTGGSNSGTLSYALDGSYTGVALEGNQLTVDSSVATGTTITIKVTAEETGNYNKEEQTFTVKVADKNTATVTITGLPDTVTYGQEFTLTASQTGDTTGANKKWTWDYDREYFKLVGPNANTETITLQAIKASTPSKDITATYESGTHKGSATVNAVVEKKEVTVSGIAAENKEYDGGTTATVNASGATITGKVDSDDLTVSVATGSTFDSADAGSRTVTLGTLTLDGTSAGNYTLATSGNQTTATANITVRDLTVKPNSGQSKSYGTTPDPVLAYTSTGTVTGETAAFDGALSREAGEDVGQYDITKGSLELKDSGTFKATNYNLVLDTAVVTFEITKGTYGGSAPTKTVNILKNYAGVQTGRLTAADFFTTAPAEAKITNAVPNSNPSSMMSLAGADLSGNFTYDSKTNITAASDESWTVTISSKNYTDINATLTFKLVDKTDVSAQITFPTGTLTYNGAGQKYEKATISGVSGGTWNYTYVANSGTGASLDSAGLPKTAGTYTVTAKYEDDAHIGTKPATLTVSKATPTGAPTCTKITTSSKTLADAPLAIGTIAPAGGTLAWDMAANTVVAANTAYGWTYTPADTANYKALTGSLTPYAVSSGGGGGGSSAATPSVSDKAAKELKNAKEGSTVTIDMKGETKLPASVTKEIAGKDVTVELDMGGGMVWSFNGLDVPKGGVRLDLGVKTGTKTIPAKVINALTGEATTIQLQLNHNGPFGMSLKLSVDLGKKHDGLYANLYIYNPKSGELEFQSAGMISGGKASWVFDHASDYAIVIDKESHEPMTFTDVPDTAYYAEAVNWAVAKKITEGVGNKLFGSNDPCTRAQIVTFLWRAAGSPGLKTMSGFSDVPADSYYAKAVAWAVENGITGGTGDGKFSPDATCTRAQAVTFLYRASGAPAVSGNAAFSDVATNAYYAAAVKWAEKNGITGGIGGGRFDPNGTCTRAQIVTFLYRSYQSK